MADEMRCPLCEAAGRVVPQPPLDGGPRRAPVLVRYDDGTRVCCGCDTRGDARLWRALREARDSLARAEASNAMACEEACGQCAGCDFAHAAGGDPVEAMRLMRGPAAGRSDDAEG